MAREETRAPVTTEPPDPGIQLDTTLHGWSDQQLNCPRVGHLLGGRYRIERILGEGGMGVVYLATDQQVPGETFAVKVLKDPTLPNALGQLREEVRKARSLSHPNIVDVHSVNLEGQQLYLLMEYLQGKSLEALLAEDYGRGLPLGRAWPIIEDVAAALANAHDHNIIHCDLKPANVFVTTAGRTKLLDFGIARVSRGKLLRADAHLRGLTPAYASCEMLEGKEADRRDDIYSFACVIYEMLCGEHPFGGLSALQARTAGLRVAPLQQLSQAQNNALRQALAFGRDTRTGTVEMLLAGLKTDAGARARSFGVWMAATTAAVLAAAVTYLSLNGRPAAPPHGALGTDTADSVQQPGASAGQVTVAAPENSIAVLPFLNISGDHSQDYFSDGLAEELIDRLVHSTDLSVTARSSSFQFRGKSADIRAIARTLNVGHLLEGSVRKDGENLRIAAQLVRGSDGMEIWSQTFDRKLVDIFEVQSEISERVAQALSVALRDDHSSARGVPDIRAYNLVLEGNFFKARRTMPDVQKAVRLYQQAIAIDPGYALAWARLASAYLVEDMLTKVPSDERGRLILAALDRAMRLDPKLAWSYYTHAGFEVNVTWDWAAAEADVNRIRQIDPRFEVLPRAFGDLALMFGNAERAVDLYRMHLDRSPLEASRLDSLGAALCAANRLSECLEARLRLLQLHPEYGGVDRAVGLAHLYLGHFEQALAVMQKEPQEDYRLAGLAIVYAAMGRRTASDSALQSLTARYADRDAYEIAQVHAYRGEIDESFRWLDRAYQAHSFAIVAVKTDPLLGKLREDPRFQVLLSRLRLDGRAPSVDMQM